MPGWYGAGSSFEQLIAIRGELGKELLQELYNRHLLFRLTLDSVEKTLLLVDLEVAEKYAELVTNVHFCRTILSDIQSEYSRTRKFVLQITGEDELCDRFPNFKRHFGRRLKFLNQVGIEQAELIRKFRAVESSAQDRQNVLVSLLLSINCVAAGIGSTG